MASRELALDYDGERVTFDVEGETAWGEPGLLLDGDDDLIAGRPWAASGFTVEPFLEASAYDRLAAGIQSILTRRIAAAGISVPPDFAMERYHDVVTTDAAHQAVSNQVPDSIPMPPEASSSLHDELAAEQAYVDHAYACLENTRRAVVSMKDQLCCQPSKA